MEDRSKAIEKIHTIKSLIKDRIAELNINVDRVRADIVRYSKDALDLQYETDLLLRKDFLSPDETTKLKKLSRDFDICLNRSNSLSAVESDLKNHLKALGKIFQKIKSHSKYLNYSWFEIGNFENMIYKEYFNATIVPNVEYKNTW